MIRYRINDGAPAYNAVTKALELESREPPPPTAEQRGRNCMGRATWKKIRAEVYCKKDLHATIVNQF